LEETTLRLIPVLPAFLFCLLLSGCGADKSLEVTRNGFYLDTLITVTLYDYDASSNGEEILDKAFDEVERLEGLLSISVSDNDIDRIGKESGIKPVKVSGDTLFIIEKSLEYSKLSKGLFDISIGPLVDLWNITGGQGHLPTEQELDKAVALVDYEDIVIDGDTVFLKKQGMELNLGAIAKGYIADRIKTTLIDEGVSSAVINLGGNVLLIGENSEGKGFNIGLQNPMGDTGSYFAVLSESGKSIVSAGSYERNFTHEGKVYHHILNPITGYPADNTLVQVTVISDESIVGDALSTTAFLMGLEEGIKLIENTDGAEAVFVTKDKKVYITSGIKDNFAMTDDTFTIVKNNK
jgi:thiamine biosynthesis lipoprotein